MIRRIAVCILAFSLTALVAAAADDPRPEPPVELKKKKKADVPDEKPAPKAKDTDPKKDPEPKKDFEPKKDGEDGPPPAGEDEKQVLERINKNMKASEDRLKNKDPGDATRQIQKDIVKDLDALIKQTQQQQDQNQPMGSGGGASSSKNSKNQPGGGSATRPKRNPSSRPGSGTQTKQEPGSGTQPGAGKTSSGDVSKMADLYKDIWGHLPETLRLEMDAYAREQFMAKYSELLKQYYSTIAERRREGEK